MKIRKLKSLNEAIKLFKEGKSVYQSINETEEVVSLETNMDEKKFLEELENAKIENQRFNIE